MEIRESTKTKYEGARYHHMTILRVERRDPRNKHHYFVACRCECGVEKEVRLSCLQQGSTRSCGCSGRTSRLKANRGHTRSRHAPGDNVRRTLFNNYRRHAYDRGLGFDLTMAEFLEITTRPCFYCDAPPFQVKYVKGAHGTYTYSGVDRVDNSLGYTTGNCVPACRPCNAAKNAVTKDMVFRLFQRLFPHTSPAQQPADLPTP